MQNFDSNPGAHKMMSTGAVVGITGADREEHDEDKSLRMFRNRLSVDISSVFLEYRLRSGNDDILEMSIVQIACFNAPVATVLTCFKRREKRGRYEQKVYAVTLASHVH